MNLLDKDRIPFDFASDTHTLENPTGTNCPVCGSVSYHLRHKVKSVQYVICEKCKTTRIMPYPSLKEAKRFYLIEDYYKNEDRNFGYSDYTKQEPGLKRTFLRRMLIAERRVKNKAPRVLEIGGGLGFFADVVKNEWECEYMGIDLNPEAVSTMRSRGYAAEQCAIAELPDDMQFDAIFFFDVLEHILEPIPFLTEVSKRLSPSGYIMFTTPNTDSFLSLISGEKWVSYIVPQHVLLYNKYSIRFLLKKTGFHPILIRHDIQWTDIDFVVSRVNDLSLFLGKMLHFLSFAIKYFFTRVAVLNGNMLVLAKHA